MTTIERMKKERDRLLEEAKKIDEAITLLRRFQHSEEPPLKKVATKQSLRGSGIYNALRESFKDAIITHGRPVTKQEILEFLPKRGFAKTDISSTQFAQCAYAYFAGDGRRGKKDNTYWFKGQPRSEKAEWKEELEKLK